MKTKTINLYEFDELSEQAQQKAIDSLSDLNTDYEWWDCTYEDFHTMAEYFGIDVDLKKTYFTGFWHQGQGSAYTADVDVIKLVECVKTESWKQHAPKENLSFYKVTPNIERVCKLISSGAIDYRVWVETSNRETNVRTQVEFDINYTDETKCAIFPNIDKSLNELSDLVEDVCTTLNNWFFTNLRNECDYLTSKEAIIETIKANEYTFTENGKLEN
jgi:hypothetical protein